MHGTITNYNTEWDIQQTSHLDTYVRVLSSQTVNVLQSQSGVSNQINP